MVESFAGNANTRVTSKLSSDRRARALGFTLIELLIAVFVVGVLVAVAVPTYFNFVNRSKVSEAFTFAAPIRRAVEEYWAINALLPASNASIALNVPSHYAGRYVSGIEVVGNGVIQVSLDHPGRLSGHLLFSPTAAADSSVLRWRCSSPNIAPQHLPKDCRP